MRQDIPTFAENTANTMILFECLQITRWMSFKKTSRCIIPDILGWSVSITSLESKFRNKALPAPTITTSKVAQDGAPSISSIDRYECILKLYINKLFNKERLVFSLLRNLLSESERSVPHSHRIFH